MLPLVKQESSRCQEYACADTVLCVHGCRRAEAADELNPAAHRININTLASELAAQAASWQLLQVSAGWGVKAEAPMHCC